MYFLGTHPFLIFIIFTIPGFGWILLETVKDRLILYVLCLCILLLLPLITGYSYTMENLDTVLIYFGLSCLYYLIIKYALSNLKPANMALIFLGIGVIVFCVSIFIAPFTGTTTTEKTWELKGYKVEYLRDQGWAGGPLMTYQLYKYGYLPIFIKHVDTKVDSDTTNNCTVKFEYENFSFDKCK